jgi:glycosyltransferase involved in cell wall biosynthesis
VNLVSPQAGCALVSVLTPVYNGEKYLAQCIESVLSQTYTNWEYVIVNNCSKDRTLEIATDYASRDRRIRVHSNATFVSMMENHNLALQQMPAASKYCKMVHADDWLYPECLARMVQLAEANPSVGIVGANGFDGSNVLWNQLRPPTTVVPGREICRRTLLGGFYVFGSQTALLFRSDLIRQQKDFFDVSFFTQFADNEACFRVLQNADFGFVHQVLTFTRLHEESMTKSIAQTAFDGILPGSMRILAKYGPVYLSKAEYVQRVKAVCGRYHQFLGRNLLRFRNSRFRDVHLGALESAGQRLSFFLLTKAVIAELATPFLSPRRAARKIFRLIKKTLPKSWSSERWSKIPE